MDKISGLIRGIGSVSGGIVSATPSIHGEMTVPKVKPPAPYEGPYTVTPTEEAQTLETTGLMMEDDVTVNAVPGDYVGSGIDRRSSADLTASGATVSVPAGYYEESGSKAVQSGSATTPAESITAKPSISVSASGAITASVSTQASITPTVQEGYVTEGTPGTVTVTGSATEQLPTQAGKTVTPTESQQTAVGSGKFTTGSVKVDAIPSDYVGSSIDRRDGDDLSASGATVSVPAGYYEENASKSVASGTAGTPTASKGAVSNHSVTVTPSVTNSAGYIAGGTKTGAGVSVSAGELVSGTKSITANDTGIDVTTFAAVDVAVPIPTTVLQTKAKTYTPTTSQQTDTITADAGYDALEEVDVTVSAMPAGSYGAPTWSTNKTSSYYNMSVSYPSFSAGYLASGPTTSSSLALETKTATPSTSSQTITPTSNSRYLNSVTVNPIPSEYIIPAGTKSITANGTGIDVAEYAAVDVAVPSVESTFVVTLSYNTSTQMWEPNKTIEEIRTADMAGKEIAVICSGQLASFASASSGGVLYGGEYIYNVRMTDGVYATKISYIYDEFGVRVDLEEDYIDSSDADASAEDILSGRTAYVNNVKITGTISTRSSSDLTASGATVTAPAGYYASQATKTVSSGSATPASSISATGASVSTGTNTLTLSKSVSNTPQVSAGYVSSGTAGNSSVSLTASVTTKAAATITPGTSNQTIASGTYLTGVQTISGDANLIAGNIKSGTTIFNVLGTYTGGGGGGGIGTLLNTTSLGSISSSSTSAASLNISLSVSEVNNYDLLIVESSVNSVTNNRHTCTVGLIFLTASSNVNTKNGATIATAKLNMKISSSAVTTTNVSTTAYGIYPNSCSISSGTASIPMYRRYNSTSTGTINGTYTARVYGVNLYDLIGG